MSKNKRIKPEELGNALAEIIDEYTQEVSEGVPEDVKSTGQACVRILRSYIDAAGIGGTKYRNAITVKTTKETPWATTVEVWAGRHYRLAHLLEHGHPIVTKSGKVVGAARAFPHWQKAEKDASDLLEKKITMRVRGEF